MKSIPPPPSSTTVTPNPADTGCQSDDSRPRDDSATTEADVEAVGGEDPRKDYVLGDEVDSVGYLKPDAAASPPVAASPSRTVATSLPPVVVPLKLVTPVPAVFQALNATPATRSSLSLGSDLVELQWPNRLAGWKRPQFDPSFLDLPAITALVWKEIHAANNPPFLYRFGGRIHWIESAEAGQPRLRRVRRDELRHVASRVVFWAVKQGKQLLTAVPPAPVMDDMLVTPESHLPVLDRIVGTPVFASDGRLIVTPGYDAESGILYAPSRNFVLPQLPPHPTGTDVQAALAVIEDIIQDFAFVDQSDRAHILSMFLLPLVRELILGPTPLHLIKKPAPGTGAGLLVDVLMSTVLGRQLTVMTEGRGEEEMRKRITAKLRAAPAGVLLDNLRARLDSAALAAVLTAIIWEDQLLGKSQILQLPVRCVWVATGNNPSLSSEIARRTIPIHLDARVARPWLREGFQHSDLRGYAAARRADIVAAGLTICQAWIEAGRPPGSKTIGMFEEWSRVMGGVLEVAGVPGFLGNLPTFYDDANDETAVWEALFNRWWQTYGERPVGAADLYILVVGVLSDDPIQLDLGKSTEHGQKTALGTKLKQMKGRIFGGYRLEKAGTRHGAGLWRLVPAGEPR